MTNPIVFFDLQIDGLSFQYDDGSLALDDLNFHLPDAGFLAIVGPSGAGKSTLVNLLLRFWDPDKGHIFLEGKDLREYCASDVRSWMGVLSQNTQIFNATVRDNVLLANPEAEDDAIRAAARRALIHDFIMEVPGSSVSPRIAVIDRCEGRGRICRQVCWYAASWRYGGCVGNHVIVSQA